MASLTSAPTLPPTLSRLSSLSPREYVEALPTRSRRALLRLAYATPLLAVGTALAAHGYRDGANATLIGRARVIAWGSRDLSFVANAYPPVPSALAKLFPHAAVLALIGALASGVLLEAVHRRVRSAGVPLPVTVALVAMLAATPGFAYTATTNLGAFLAVVLVAVALDGFTRFIHHGHTHGGFTAGLALGVAGLCHPAAIVVAVGFAAAAPLVARHRFRSRPAAGRATAAVLLFPTVAGLLGWTFLCWRFAHSPLAWLHRSAPGLFELDGAGAMVHDAVTGVAKPLLLTPLFLAAVVLTARTERLLAGLGLLVPVVAIMLADALGLGLTPGATAALLGAIALGSLPRRLSPPALLAIVSVALVGLAMKWTLAGSPGLAVWEHAVTR